MRACLVLAVMFCSASALADDVELNGRLEQGGFVIGRTNPNATVMLDDTTISVASDGTFVLGFDRDAKPEARLVVTTPAGQRTERPLSIAPRQWLIEKVDGLPQKLVTPDLETEVRIAADNKLMAAARMRTEPTPFYDSGFIRPAQGRISGVFGSQRILNGIPRAPHMGLDIAGPVGTPVVAAADGVVSLANANMVLTGQTVVIEQGFGLDTVYIHMSDIKVVDGQRVKQGDVIGAIGQSGRATGPHLHFGVTWFNTRLDPETVLAVLPAKAN